MNLVAMCRVTRRRSCDIPYFGCSEPLSKSGVRLAIAALAIWLPVPLLAVCELPHSAVDGRDWAPIAQHQLGADDSIHDALVWEDGGNSSIFIGGEFQTVERSLSPGVSKWNGSEWLPVSAQTDCRGFDGAVYALGSYNGNLIAAGDFSEVDSQPIDSLASWNGSSWSAFQDAAIDGPVRALVDFQGELIIAGEFSTIGSIPARNIARWNGASWSALGGFSQDGTNGEVRSLAVYESSLFIGGEFTIAGDVSVSNIARWDGSSWHPVTGSQGEGATDSVDTITTYGDKLIVGGSFRNAGGVSSPGLASWNGVDWQQVPGFPGNDSFGVRVYSASRSGSRLYVAYEAINPGIFFPQLQAVQVWDGSQWSSMLLPDGEEALSFRLKAIDWRDSDVVAGTIWPSSNTATDGIYRKIGSAWAPLTSIGDRIAIENASAFLQFEGMRGSFVAGSFSTQTDRQMTGVARVTDDGLSMLGSPFLLDESVFSDPRPGKVRDLAIFEGDLHAAGQFNSIGSETVDGVARWNGTKWAPVGIPEGSVGSIDAMAVFRGSLIVGGNLSSISAVEVNDIARWDGENWFSLLGSNGNGLSDSGRVLALGHWSGDLAVGGFFGTAGGQIANNLAIWDGSNWASIIEGSESGVGGPVYAIGNFGDDLVIGGTFTQVGETSANNIAVWDGQSWNTLGTAPDDGLRFPTPPPPQLPVLRIVTAVAETDDSLVVGGNFTSAGPQSAENAAVWEGSGWTILPGSQINGTSGQVESWTIAKPNGFVGDALVATGEFRIAGGESAWGLAGYGAAEALFRSSFE